MRYIDVHTHYTLPVLGILLFLSYPCLQMDRYRTWIPIVILSLLSFLYTTPWDNYLIQKGGWGYPPNSVLFVVGYIPIEEYAFFIIQTCQSGLLFVLTRWITTKVPLAGIEPLPRLKLTTLSILGGLGLFGWQIAIPGTKTFYLGSILYWTMPVLILQLFFSFEYIYSLKRVLFFVIGLATGYLWMVDTIAIRNGAWTISKDVTTGIFLNPSLPFEEALFFFLTNCMIVFGLAAIERTYSILDLHPIYAGRTWEFRMVLEATWSSEFDIPQSSIKDLETCYQIISNASTSFYYSTLLLPVYLRYKVFFSNYVDLENLRICKSM
jgi:lycopene cyclase domain-containing protein